MAWSASAVFAAAVLNPMTRAINAATAPTGYASLTADSVKAALFNNSITPDKSVSGTLSGYNASTSQWVVANEVIDTLNTNWVAGGVALASKAYALGTGTPPNTVAFFSAANTAGAGNLTITNAFGCLVYDATITSPNAQGMCFNYFGGAQTVTNGTFTIVWDATGVFKFTT
jgi:hypothetical protein